MTKSVEVYSANKGIRLDKHVLRVEGFSERTNELIDKTVHRVLGLIATNGVTSTEHDPNYLTYYHTNSHISLKGKGNYEVSCFAYKDPLSVGLTLKFYEPYDAPDFDVHRIVTLGQHLDTDRYTGNELFAEYKKERYPHSPDSRDLSEDELREFLEEINDSLPDTEATQNLLEHVKKIVELDDREDEEAGHKDLTVREVFWTKDSANYLPLEGGVQPFFPETVFS